MDGRIYCRVEGLRDAAASEELSPGPSMLAATLPRLQLPGNRFHGVLAAGRMKPPTPPPPPHTNPKP